GAEGSFGGSRVVVGGAEARYWVFRRGECWIPVALAPPSTRFVRSFETRRRHVPPRLSGSLTYRKPSLTVSYGLRYCIGGAGRSDPQARVRAAQGRTQGGLRDHAPPAGQPPP